MLFRSTAFTDPHQPLVETVPDDNNEPWSVNVDEEIARTLQEAEDVARTFQQDVHAAETLQDEDVARQLQESTNNNPSDTTRLDRDGELTPTENTMPGLAIGSQLLEPTNETFMQHANEGDVTNGMSTPQPRQVDPTTREVSHDSTTSDNMTASQNLGNSVSASL